MNKAITLIKFDQLMLDSIKELNTEKRASIYQKALEELNRDMPFIPIYQYSSARWSSLCRWLP